MATRRSGRTMGITRCPGCERLLTDGREVTAFEATVGTSPRQVMAGHGTTQQVVRWHTECLADFRALNERTRAAARAQMEADIRAIAEAAGVEPPAFLA